jgi:hypothetical protein
VTAALTATAATHWHAFAYTGKGWEDREVARGLAPPTFPPTELATWADRRPGLRVFTESEIDEAVAWLDKELSEYVPMDDESFPISVRLEYSRKRLQERVNRDVWHGYWTKRGQLFVTRVLYACTDTNRSKGCA